METPAGSAGSAAKEGDARTGWAPTTRRRFLGMVVAAGAVGAVAPKAVKAVSGEEAPLKPRWIGHC